MQAEPQWRRCSIHIAKLKVQMQVYERSMDMVERLCSNGYEKGLAKSTSVMQIMPPGRQIM